VAKPLACTSGNNESDDVHKALKEPLPEQTIEFPPDIAARAKCSVDRMLKLEKEGNALLEKQGSSALPWTG
jgi:quinolinate synthase